MKNKDICHSNEPHGSCGCGDGHSGEPHSSCGCGCDHEHDKAHTVREIALLSTAFAIWLAAVAIEHFTKLQPVYSLALYVISYIVAGYQIVFYALRNLFSLKILDENFLMTIASIGAFVIGEYPEAAAVMIFYRVGELLQGYAVSRSKKSITELMDISADHAIVLKDNVELRLAPEDVQPGDIMIVRAGEKIALDGEIIFGRADLDTKAVTGESLPRIAEVGHTVLSGFVNLSGLLHVRATKTVNDSTAARIMQLTEVAARHKAKVERFISRFAAYYTPAIIIAALLIFLIPSILSGFSDYSRWLYRALSFVVISCPCALVISIPLTFFVGIGGASRMGILIKGADFIDLASKADTVVFDKTGTLTCGSFKIQEIKADGISDSQLKLLLASIERYSKHPIAQAVTTALSDSIPADSLLEIRELQEPAGRGIIAIPDPDSLSRLLPQRLAGSKKIFIGNEHLLSENGIQAAAVSGQGTVVHVAAEAGYLGYVLLSDEIRAEAAAAVSELKALGISRQLILTGDDRTSAASVAAALGLDFYAELLPGEKLERLDKLMKDSRHSTIYVGDGLNDAPVLKAADVGIAMGGIATAAAVEASDVVLMTDNLSGVSRLLALSKKTMRIVKENIVMVLFIKLLVLALAAVGLTGIWAAIFADVGVAVLAVLNAGRAVSLRKQ